MNERDILLKYMIKEGMFLYQIKWNSGIWQELEEYFPEIKHIQRPENCLKWLKNNKPQYFI